jgi:hypothetical protein
MRDQGLHQSACRRRYFSPFNCSVLLQLMRCGTEAGLSVQAASSIQRKKSHEINTLARV